MALSPSHRLGQFIGDQLEAAVKAPLSEITQELGLYLDFPHRRKVRSNRKKVAWKDSNGNTHLLDYVLEEGGSNTIQGNPKAFVEVAWRRYTRHSRNKAQEIQGAVLPLAETYQNYRPFLGAVLAGVFTEASLEQLRSHRFNIVYCPYDTVVQAFQTAGVDISSEENSTDAELERKVESAKVLSEVQLEQVRKSIISLNSHQFEGFFGSLRSSLGRKVKSVSILPLSGTTFSFSKLEDAIRFISEHVQLSETTEFIRYELILQYSNGEEIRCSFNNKERVIEFLNSAAI